MNSHYAAGLLLFGWYLMVPPLVQHEGKLIPDPHAPLADWQHIESFVSADTCRQGAVEYLRSILETTIAERSEGTAAVWQSQLADCFSADDLRLKENWNTSTPS